MKMVKNIRTFDTTFSDVSFPSGATIGEAYTLMKYDTGYEKNTLYFKVLTSYRFEDVINNNLQIIADSETGFEILTDGKITAHEFYPLYEKSVNDLIIHLETFEQYRNLAPSHKVQVNISQIEKFEKLAHWFSNRESRKGLHKRFWMSISKFLNHIFSLKKNG